mgnify:CR=1 FL=1
MSEKKSGLKNWEDVIINFFQSKIEKEEVAYLKNKIKEASKIYRKQDYFNDNEIETFFNPPQKNKKDVAQSQLEFLRLKYKKLLGYNEKVGKFKTVITEDEYHQKCSDLVKKYDPHNWINKASQDASSVSFATHVIKLTHSKIDGSSIYDQISSQKNDILTTSSLKEIIVDGAVTGNQFAPIFQFLELEFEGKKLANILIDESNTVLNQFAKSPDELALWNDRFKKALLDEKLSSHFLAKQIYYPIFIDDILSGPTYHLLCNIPSSSLAHAIYLVLKKDIDKKTKDQLNKSKHSENTIISYPQRAIINVTASNHSNASQLNGVRSGKLHLFSTQPPTWESQLKPPTNKRSFFQASLNSSRIKETISYLREFLIRFQIIDLSINNPERKKWVDHWAIQIIDEIMIYAMSIQNLPAGWSLGEDIKLKPAYQYFLDPFRQDEQFQNARQEVNWQIEICKDFANWLNWTLKGKNKLFTPRIEHTRMWMKLMEKELMEHTQAIEWEIKEKKRKE